MHLSEIIQKAILIRDYLKNFMDDPENEIDDSLLPVAPFKISSEIKVIIIAQDPTIQQKKSRQKIDITLNLDKNGALKNYVEKICKNLNVKIENIYATNLFKYFYKHPPEKTFNVLKKHLEPNLKLLIDELDIFGDVPILTLGEPVLKLLAKDSFKSNVHYYWGFEPGKDYPTRAFEYCRAEINLLNRNLFPLAHQPAFSKIGRYKNAFDLYLKFTYDTCKNLKIL
ncbi:hypothetical protein ACX8XN_03500 [Calditrichota bacterium GD2]